MHLKFSDLNRTGDHLSRTCRIDIFFIVIVRYIRPIAIMPACTFAYVDDVGIAYFEFWVFVHDF